jgi:hypothetical protein
LSPDPTSTYCREVPMCAMSPRLLRPRALFNPRNIVGLQGWWDFGDTSSLWQNSNGTTAVNVGDPIGRATDKSGNGRHAQQGTDNFRPHLEASAIGSRVAAEFDGDNDFLETVTSNLTTGSAGRTLIVVYKPLRTTGVNFLAGQTRSGNNGWFALQARDSPAGDPYFAGFAADSTDGASITQTSKIACVTYDGTNVVLFRNNSQIAQDARSLNTVSGILNIGCAVPSSTPAEFAKAMFGEVLHWNVALTSTDRTSVHRYLSNKWGITL